MPTRAPRAKSKPTKVVSWRAKLERVLPSHGTIEPGRQGERMLIPRPLDVDAAMRSIRKGHVLTMGELRARLASAAGAQTTCPMCTGIFARIAAEAAEEDRRAGRARITPYWRLVRDDGSMNDKFPGGASAQAEKLRVEGRTIVLGKGKRHPRVAGVGGA